ncbi:MAG TPA: histidine phosphatase family protein [Candidatus Dormibacteraeota bacterium]
MPEEPAAEAAVEVTRIMRRVEQAFLFGVPGTTEVWLIRHGDCYQEMTDAGDPPLSPLGREQARRIGERVRQTGVAAVYSSDSRRALETAQAISGEVVSDPRLREIENDPTAAVQLILNRRQSFTESAEAVARRMHEAVDEAAAAHPGGRIALVTHGVAILCYIGSLMGLEIAAGLRLMPYYTSVTVVRVNLVLDRRMVGSLVDATHLAGMGD